MSFANGSLFDDRKNIQERFEEWLKANPEVVRLCLLRAREVRDAGWNKYSMKAIFERVRWHVQIELKRECGFYVNNDFSSRMARHLMTLDPTLDGMFELRELKST